MSADKLPQEEQTNSAQPIKNKGGRPSKAQYATERKEICDKLLNILGITKENRVFYFDDLDSNIDKQQLILDMKPDIKKYFVCGKWTVFAKETDKPYASLARAILKASNIKTASIYLMDEKNKNVKKRGLQLE